MEALAPRPAPGYSFHMKRSFFLAACLAFGLALLAHHVIAGEKNAPKLEANKQRDQIDAMQGKPAPELKLKGWLNSKPLNLPDLKGKIVVLDFWATWCGPCLASIPHNNELAKKYAAKGVVLIGVCAPNGGEKMAQVVKDKGIEYPVTLDDGGATFKALKGDSFPDYYIIDRKGNLLWGDVVNSDVEHAIELALAADQM